MGFFNFCFAGMSTKILRDLCGRIGFSVFGSAKRNYHTDYGGGNFEQVASGYYKITKGIL